MGERAAKGDKRHAGERSTGNIYITFDYDSDPFTPLFLYVTNLFNNTFLNDTWSYVAMATEPKNLVGQSFSVCGETTKCLIEKC